MSYLSVPSLPDGSHMAVDVHHIEVGDGGVARGLAGFGFKVIHIATLGEGVDAQHLSWLELVALSADDAHQASLFPKVLHLLQN